MTRYLVLVTLLALSPGAAAALAAPPAAPLAGDHDTLEGVVASVEGAMLRLQGGATVTTDGKTQVTRGGKPCRLADLQAGDRVKYALAPGGAAMYVHAEPKR